MPVDPSDPDVDDPREKPAEAPQLSFTQVIASALAAVSTTVLLSYFGIAGTIIGAGVASVATVLGNYAYTRSIVRTREQLRPVVGQLSKVSVPAGRSRSAAGTTVEIADDRTTMVLTADSPTDGQGADGDAVPDDAATTRGPWLRLMDRHGKRRVLAVSAALLFVVVMGVVLVTETVIGKPLSDAVRGQDGSGTSISRGVTTTGDDTDTPTQEQLPSDEGTDPTDDPTSVPSDDTTPEPAPEPTDPATDDPAEDPTGTPTDAPTDAPVDPTDPTDPAPEPSDPATPGTGDGGSGGTGSTGDGTGTGGSAETAPEDTGGIGDVASGETGAAASGDTSAD